MTSLIIPLIFVCTGLYALGKKVDVFPSICSGISNGLKTVLSIFPALCTLLPAVYMLRAAGIPELLASLLEPALSFFGIPGETATLMLLRPLSGSGALAVGSEIFSRYGPDSYIGRVAAVMLGSTETTFYVIAVYFGASGIKNTRHAVPAALVADIAGFILSAVSVRLIFGSAPV